MAFDRLPAGGAPPAPTPVPAVPAVPGAIAFSGLFDFYYAYNANRPATASSLGAGTPTLAAIPPGNNNLRYYDIYHNQLSLSLVELTVKKTGTEVNFMADLDFGQFADQNAAAVSPSQNPSAQVVDEVSKHLGQAFVTYTPSSVPGLSIDIGKMPTHVGLELMKSRDNWQYSRSTTFGFGSPFWHSGVHVGYAMFSNKLTASAYVYNGWNTIYDNNAAKTVGAQLRFVPSDSLVLIYNGLYGAEQEKNNSNMRAVHEVNMTWTTNRALAFALELLDGQEHGVTLGSGASDAHWTGLTLHSKVQTLTFYSISPRLEVYHDTNGYTVGGPGQTIYGGTLTNSFDLGNGLETRLEFRCDRSTYAERFATHAGPSPTQFTSTLGVMLSL